MPRGPRPFVKWAGGKRQLLSQLAPLFPPRWNVYFEPFVGGGAVFFHLHPERAVLSDVSEELINAYTVIRDCVEELIERLRSHRNEESYFYSIRDLDPAALSPVERAARLIYLNHTCYNGLYRVNSRGQFNVPFGRYRNPKICDADGLRLASEALRSADIRVADFEEALADAGAGDFIYMDPPFDPLSRTSSFTGYSEGGFSRHEQERLARMYRDLDRRGCLLMLSNSDTPFVRQLYEGYRTVVMQARRAINSQAYGRGAVAELAILNY